MFFSNISYLNTYVSDPEIVSCTESQSQNNYPCEEAFDGILDGDGNGWAYEAAISVSPAWVIFELDKKTKLTSLKLLSGIGGNDHRLITFKATMKVNEKWVVPSALTVEEDSEDLIGNDGTITLNSGIHVVTLGFNPIANVMSIRLEVTKTDNASKNNLRLTEIIPNFLKE